MDNAKLVSYQIVDTLFSYNSVAPPYPELLNSSPTPALYPPVRASDTRNRSARLPGR